MRQARARIIGIGQDARADDGAGIAVARHLRAMSLPDNIEVTEAGEPSAIIPYLAEGAGRIVLVDAIAGAGRSGRVLEIDPSDPRLVTGHLLSTHGVGVLEAIEIARALAGSALSRRLAIVGITIGRPKHYQGGLSKRVAAAVPAAAELALGLAARSRRRACELCRKDEAVASKRRTKRAL